MAVHGIVVSVILGKTAEDVSTLKVSGYLDITTAGELENALAGLLDNNYHKIVVDLSEVSYISSAGWGIFISEIKRVRREEGDIKLTSMRPEVREVFELLEFDNILRPYDIKDEAIRDFDPEKQAARPKKKKTTKSKA